MRYIEIDGKRHEISTCDDCPIFHSDAGWFFCEPTCLIKTYSNITDKVYVIFRDGADPYESDEMIDIYMDRDEAQKFVDSQSYPTWYHIEKWKVKI